MYSSIADFYEGETCSRVIETGSVAKTFFFGTQFFDQGVISKVVRVQAILSIEKLEKLCKIYGEKTKGSAMIEVLSTPF